MPQRCIGNTMQSTSLATSASCSVVDLPPSRMGLLLQECLPHYRGMNLVDLPRSCRDGVRGHVWYANGG